MPNSLVGLVVWAVGRFGGGALIGAILLVGINKLYEDNRATNQALISVLQDNARTSTQTVVALDAIRVEFREAHQRALRNP